MGRLSFLLAGAGLLATGRAWADDGSTTPPAPQTEDEADAELANMAAAELKEENIVIYDLRPDKPFDRDTDVRLTGEQLAARGATDLASALALLPDVNVRDAGRGGSNIDVRGARKGAVTILIDGVSVSDPFYGTFDVSTIPITDIVQIRVSTNAQSPIDGPGGPGGVIEVYTRDAIGPQIVVARATTDSLPTFGVTGTARAALAKHWALRVSASGLAGTRDLPLPGVHTVNEDRHAATGATRLEYRDGDRRVAVDGFIDSRHYISPPAEVGVSDILMIDRETSMRTSIKIDDKFDKLQVQGQGWVHYLTRRSLHFADYTLANQTAVEDLDAWRTGGHVLVTHPIGRDARWALSTSVDRDAAHVANTLGQTAKGDATTLEVAGDLQYEKQRLRIDGAAGVAVPFGVDASPWPEGKLTAKYKVVPALEVTATAARKGRVPTLRERFDLTVGNPNLRPELAWAGELRGVYQKDRVRVELAPYVRRSSNTIRQTLVATDVYQQTNLDRVNIYGVDASARVKVHAMVEVGGSFGWIHARSNSVDPALAMTPLDRLPETRADGWVQVTPDRRISVLARARYFGTTLDQSMPVPAYTLFEATVTAPITKEYLGVLRVDDVTDVAPQTRAGYNGPGRIISVVVQGSWE